MLIIFNSIEYKIIFSTSIWLVNRRAWVLFSTTMRENITLMMIIVMIAWPFKLITTGNKHVDLNMLMQLPWITFSTKEYLFVNPYRCIVLAYHYQKSKVLLELRLLSPYCLYFSITLFTSLNGYYHDLGPLCLVNIKICHLQICKCGHHMHAW